MSKFGNINQKHSAENPVVGVIFLHGLTGDPDETWQCEKSDDFWPIWLVEEMGRLNIYTIGYDASLFQKWAKKEMDIFERAENLLENMAAIGIGSRPIVFVTQWLRPRPA